MSQQLSLQMSLTDGVALQEELARWTEYARDEHARAEEMTEEAESFAEECDSLRTALQAAEAKALAYQREAIQYRTTAEFFERMLTLRTGSAGGPPPPTPSKAVLTWMLTVIHSDKHHGAPDEALAHEATIFVNRLRQGGQA